MTTHSKHNSHSTQSKQTAHKAVSHPAVPAREARAAAAVAAPASTFNTQTLLVFALVIAAFFGAYRFARASNSAGASTGVAGATTQAGSILGAGAGAGGAGGGCCGGGGGGGGGAAVTGTAKVENGVQKINVDASQGYNPNTIQLKAGVPTEITFSQSGGCTAIVQSRDLGFQEDLTSGPKTVKLAALQPGTYGFACGMNMVQGQVVVQ